MTDTLIRPRCKICTSKIPKQQPRLSCALCKTLVHLKCHGLTKSDTRKILDNGSWYCFTCLSDILPVNAASEITSHSYYDTHDRNKVHARFKCKCDSCNGYIYSQKNVRNCVWCEKSVHTKCWRGTLGCTSCCDNMIPGANVYSHELNDNFKVSNDTIFNPYHTSHLTNQIGDLIENENGNDIWNEISDFLVSCQYK